MGDRVAIPWLATACGTCEHCVSGWETLCEQQQNSGYSVDGASAEYALADSRYVGIVPNGVDPLVAAPLTCAGVTTYKAVTSAGTRPSDLAAVFGIGGLGAQVAGVYVSRRMSFLGRPIRWGGVFPIRVLRLFRAGRGRCEDRWMDEHILVNGTTAEFHGEIMDDNLNSLSWWTEKHNGYASREVVDLLNLEYGFMKHETVADLRAGQQAGVKRWLKEQLYARLPGGLRAFAYFLFRYVFRLGFLDGREGTAFHVLQGFWYRYLVDMKLHEVKIHMRRTNVDVVTAIRDVLGIDIAG